MLASAVTLRNHFEKDELVSQLGGKEYLARLSGLGISVFNVIDYAKLLQDLHLKREVIRISKHAIEQAYAQNIPTSALEQIEHMEQGLFNLATEGMTTGFRDFKYSIRSAEENIKKAYEKKETITGISTGFYKLDDYLHGFQNSDLVILAARPSMGKTALAINMAINACKFLETKHSKSGTIPSVGVFSLEMSAEQLATRMIAMAANVESKILRTGKFSAGAHGKDTEFNRVMDSAREIEKHHLFIDDTPALTISSLRTRARRLKRNHNLGILFIDYLQLIRGSSRSSENRVQEISEITQGLKAIAKELSIPVIALSQLSRAVEQRENKRPLLSDLRESGSIEQDADIVMFIYREEYYLERRNTKAKEEELSAIEMDKISKAKNIAEVIIAKHRSGPVGDIMLHFEAGTTKFSNLSTDY
jgi:replicative DNA helicase